MRNCKFCQRFWAGVYQYSLLIVTALFTALCLGLYVVVML